MGIYDYELGRLSRLHREFHRFDELHRMSDELRRIDEMQKAMRSQNDVVRRLLQIQDRYRQAHEALAGPTAHLKELQRTADLYRSALESTQAMTELAEWTRLSDFRPRDALQSTWALLANQSLLLWQSSLGALTSQLDVVGAFADAITRKRITAPLYAFSEFSRATLSELSATHREADKEALQASLVLAEHQVASGTELIADSLTAVASHGGGGGPGGGTRGPDIGTGGGEPEEEESGDSEENQLTAASGTNAAKLFALQRRELLAVSASEPVVSQQSLLVASPSARAAQLARRLVNTVGAINRARLLVSQDEVFTPTTAAFIATNTLAYTAVTDEQSLGEAVDALYVLIYEGSGEMKRVLTWVSKTVCDPVWWLKNLRNSWLRHDPQHGPSSDQAKKFAKLSEALLALGANTIPHSVEEYQRTYERLLEALCEMLDRLLAAIAEHAARS
jgi:hypothetical protein